MVSSRKLGLLIAVPVGLAGLYMLQPAPEPQPSGPAADAQAERGKLPGPQAASTSKDAQASSDAAAPAAPKMGAAQLSFRDARLPVPGEQQAAIGSLPMFSDARPLTVPAFRDARPISAPTFRDDRLVVQPALRDERPISAPTFRDGRPIIERPAPEPAPAAQQEASAAEQPARQPTSTAAAAAAAAMPVTAPATPAAAEPLVVAALSPGIAAAARPECAAPDVSGQALDGGRMRLRASARCKAGQTVHISYGGAELIRTVDAAGELDVVLDCFAGAGSMVEVRFLDGARKIIPVAANDLDKVSKVAVIWRAPVNLDLHVFEYAARFGQPGHVWANASSTLEEARTKLQAERKGRGFLSSVDAEGSFGDKLEVYTLLHDDAQAAGAIGLALDYETRGNTPSGATCGGGQLAEIEFQVVILPRGGKAARQSGLMTRVECGARLTPETRFNQATLPGLRIRR